MKAINRIILQTILPFLATVSGHAFATTATGATSEPLLQNSDLVYQGSFRLPAGATSQLSFNYAGRGLAYNPVNNSLFITGHTWYQLTAEVSIPEPVNSSNLSDLPTATLLQGFSDATGGERSSVNPKATTPQNIGGYLVFNGKLYVSVYSAYDGNGTQIASHFARPLDLSSNQVSGPYRVGSQYPGFVSGYMALIPSEWQSLFGGPALTGNCCLAISGWQSNGPAVSEFNPASLQEPTSQVPATALVGYPLHTPLGTGWATQSTLFNGSTVITGVVFPAGTRSVLFFGRQGLGPFCYGPGTSDSALAGTLAADGDPWCYDPVHTSKGTHAYPYVYQVWAYDADDLLKVAKGELPQYAVKPYATWNPSLPFSSAATEFNGLGGAAYDPSTNRIFITQQCVDSNCSPIVDVFKITSSAPAPTPPTNVAAK